MTGQSLAQYKITAEPGQGGMGAVYRATDTKLDREVAVNDQATESSHRVRRTGLEVLDCASPLALLIFHARPIAAEDFRTPRR
jgi:hypothetical protein